MNNDENGKYRQLAAQFRCVTGCANVVEASHYLEMCNGNLELAVNLYYQQLQPSSSSGGGGGGAAVVVAAANNGGNGGGNDDSPEIVEVDSSTTEQRRAEPGIRRVAITRNTSAGTSNSHTDMPAAASNGDVRAPIAPIRGAIIEQSFAQQYNRRNGRHTSSVFDTTRDFRAEADQRLAMLQNRQNASDPSAAKRMTLQALFCPPVDIMFDGDWDAVRAEAQQRGHWLLVNVQDDLEFACQILNRDVWSNSSVKELLRSNFVFWQVHKDSADGNRVGNYYRVQSHPAVFIVDPRTGEQLLTIRAKDAMSFCDQLTTFLDSCPDFETRDRQLTAVPTLSDLSQSTSKQASGSSNPDHENLAASRKRVHLMEQDEMMDDGSSPKKARESTDRSDIDSIIDSGSKLTTVDRDEWLKCVGTPDGLGCRLSLLLRLPDGERQLVEVEDTTTLQAIFMLIAGLGFYPADHQLVLNYPKRIYTDEDHYRTLRELSFSKRELIHVERK